MTTRQIEAADLEVGMVLLCEDGFQSWEITRISKQATQVSVLLGGMAPKTFRDVHELLTIVEQEG